MVVSVWHRNDIYDICIPHNKLLKCLSRHLHINIKQLANMEFGELDDKYHDVIIKLFSDYIRSEVESWCKYDKSLKKI